MGHVINPSAMRVGTLNYWEDIWYQQHLYYPEFLHQIFKMRLFLISFFGFRFFENKNIFFSHFYFIYQNRSLIVKIFLYNGALEYFFNFFCLENTLNYNLLTGRFLNIKQNFFVVVLLFFNIFLKIDINILSKWNLLFKILMKNKKNIIKKFLCKSRINKKYKNYLIFIFFILSCKKNALNNILNIWWIFFKYIILIPKFNFIKLFIDNFLNYLFQKNNINSSIYCVSNDNLNAKFLARFIARRLQQGFSIKQVMRPIIKDLLITNKFATAGSLLKKKDLGKIKLLYKINLKKYIYFFKFTLLCYYKTLNTWITIELFNFLLTVNKKLNNSIVIQVFKKYWNNFLHYNYYLNYNIQNYYLLQNYNDKYFENLFKISYCSKKNFFEQSFLFINSFLIKTSFLFINSFLKLQYLNFCSNKIYSEKFPMQPKKNLCMLGFKFHFVGRFSRRQRASSIWFMQGKLPLNTLSANIEYGYYTIALFNSAVRVKVYINRGISYNEFSFKIV